jgi:hypothetical protein
MSKSLSDFALPAGMHALSEEHHINANLRDGGVGLVPRVLAVDEDAKAATLGCGAIMAMLDIPFGWHAIDDGRRVLVFDHASNVQINFRLVDEGVDSARLIEMTLAALAPAAGDDAKWLTMELAGMKTLAIRGLPVEGDGPTPDLVDQVFIYKPVPGKPNAFCEVRTTTNLGHIEPALDMVELILSSMKFAA